jgi:hypothetical protein
MKKLTIKILCLFFLGPLSINGVLAQKFTISGTIRDAKTGEELIGASVIVKEFYLMAVITRFHSMLLT